MPCGCGSAGHRWVGGPEAQLCLSGLPVAVSPAAHWLRRLLWGLLLLLSLAYLIVQLHGSVVRLLDQKVATSSRHNLQMNVAFPSVTICSAHRFKKDQILNMTKNGTTMDQWYAVKGPSRYKVLRWDEINFDEFFERASYSYSDLVRGCSFHGRPCRDISEVTTVFTSRYGACHTIALSLPANGTWTTPQLEINLTLPDQGNTSQRGSGPGWFAILHDPNVIFTDTTLFAVFSFSYLSLPQALETSIKIHRREDRYIPVTDSPCCVDCTVMEYAECVKMCIAEDREELGGPKSDRLQRALDSEQDDDVPICRLPWERHERDDPPCRSHDELIYAMRFTADLRMLNESELYNIGYDCGCVAPCNEVTYPIGTPDRVPMRGPEALYTSRLGIWLSMRVEERVEDWSFTFNQFVAECGGNMGIFLGASLLSLVELVDFIIFWMLKKMEKKQVTAKKASVKHSGVWYN